MKRLSVAILLMMTAGAQAAPFEITDGWFRALPGKLPAGGYFTAYNGTGRDVSIMGADPDACGMLMIHQSSNKGGMSGMDMVDKVSVPAGGTVQLCARRLSPDVREPHRQDESGIESGRVAEAVGWQFCRGRLCGEKRNREVSCGAPDRDIRGTILYLMSLGISVFVFAIVYLLLRSRHGLALTAIRDFRPASASLGVATSSAPSSNHLPGDGGLHRPDRRVDLPAEAPHFTRSRI